MTLELRGYVSLPPHEQGGFDHADVHPPRRRLYVAIGQPGVVQVVNTQTMALAEEVQTEEGAHTLTFDESRQRLYVFLPRSGRAAIYAEVPGAQTP